MARETRRDARPGSGPGRGSPRSRASSRSRGAATSSRGASTPPIVEESGHEGTLIQRLDRGLSMTRRVIALIVVFAMLVLSYASSLRVYFSQQADIAAQTQAIAESDARIYELKDKIARWQDPDYVRAQARDRLGWVVPGERGYVVLGADGRPIDGSSVISSNRGLDKSSKLTWWQQIGDSIVTADKTGGEKSRANAVAPGRIEAPPQEPTVTPIPAPEPTAKPS